MDAVLKPRLKPRHPDIDRPPRGEQAPRLVVVIAGPSQEALLAGQIRMLAQPQNLPVILFGVSHSAAAEPELRRHLATVAAFLRLEHVPVTSTTCQRGDWMEDLRAAIRAGDEIACQAGRGGGVRRGPLVDVLSQALDRPIYQLADPEAEAGERASAWKQGGVWLGNVLIVAGFGFLQVRAADAISGALQTVVLLLMLAPEMALLLAWNALFP